jgi:hypothetical protein
VVFLLPSRHKERKCLDFATAYPLQIWLIIHVWASESTLYNTVPDIAAKPTLEIANAFIGVKFFTCPLAGIHQ